MSKIVSGLVVVAMVLLSCGVFVPLIGRHRALADRAKCQENLRRVAAGLMVLDAQAFPAATVVVSGIPVERRLSWYALLLSPLNRKPVADQIDWKTPWDEVPNAAIARTTIPLFMCPTARLTRDSSAAVTDYVAGGGIGLDAPNLPADNSRAGAMRYDAPTPLTAFKDGMSNTLLLLETTDRTGPWMAGGPGTLRPLDRSQTPYIGLDRPFGGLHNGGCNVAFADGSWRFLADSIGPGVLELLMAIADEP
ncbi:MAG: DUF1559 domain-containing protein [Gemmataceae bacterium]